MVAREEHSFRQYLPEPGGSLVDWDWYMLPQFTSRAGIRMIIPYFAGLVVMLLLTSCNQWIYCDFDRRVMFASGELYGIGP